MTNKPRIGEQWPIDGFLYVWNGVAWMHKPRPLGVMEVPPEKYSPVYTQQDPSISNGPDGCSREQSR